MKGQSNVDGTVIVKHASEDGQMITGRMSRKGY